MAKSPEPLIVRLAGRGDRQAFEELVRRRQSWVRNLMRRLSRNAVLADDLAQQAFLQAWRTIGQVREPAQFPGWLKRIAVNTWLQHSRRSDPLHLAEPIDGLEQSTDDAGSAEIDFDRALSVLPDVVRLCLVLSYYGEMSHGEIAESTSLPLGTVKSHIRRGTDRLRPLLTVYANHETIKAGS